MKTLSIVRALRPALVAARTNVQKLPVVPLPAARTYSIAARPASNPRGTAPRGWRAPTGARGIFIQTEDTPNKDALKFKPNSRVLPESIKAPFLEYLSPRSTLAPPYPSPLAAALLSVEGVDGVFFGADYITITKATETPWAHVKPEVFSLVAEYATGGKEMVTVGAAGPGGDVAAGGGAAVAAGAGEGEDSLAYDENDDEVVGMIKELLETRIRPTIQEDGGDIDFRGFDPERGAVKLRLRGACRTCDSSEVTLKRGIEAMLMHYIEEVKEVEQVLDPEEEVARLEFEKFEERLRKGTGRA